MRGMSFSQKEIRNVTVAALLVIAIGFSIGLYGNYFGGFNFTWTWDLTAVFAFLMAASFLLHEFMHKVIAQKNGLWAEFRLTTWGVVLTFISTFLPFRIISPGAMMIAGSPNADEIVQISIAGPLTNLILSGAFLGLAFALYPGAYGLMLFFVSYINAWMTVFNLIPVGILDGYKVFTFNKKLWALVFIPSAILAVVTFLLT
jgi:Zn-dependent protease